MPQPSNTPQAIILAAGKGTRMEGDLPKVLYPVADRPMVSWVVQACREAGVGRCIIVVGYRGQDVRDALKEEQGCEFVEQNKQLGTGHAAQMAEPCFANEPDTDVLVLAGDAPLIQAKTLSRLIEAHRSAQAAATLATAILDDPFGYGRVVRHDDGSFHKIVEQKDASPQQQQIKEINPSYYCFRSRRLFESLAAVQNNNAQNEFYLTDVPGLLKDGGDTVLVVDAVSPDEVIGVNNREQLEVADQILRKRLTGSSPQQTRQEQEA